MSGSAAGPAGDRRRYRIGEVSELMELSLRTVRYYEETGLITPVGRTRGGFRLYDDKSLERLAVIKHMKPLGFSLEEMRALLEARDRLRTVTDADERAFLLGRLAMFAAAAEERYAALREQIGIAESFVRRINEDVSRHSEAQAPNPRQPPGGSVG